MGAKAFRDSARLSSSGGSEVEVGEDMGWVTGTGGQGEGGELDFKGL